MTPPAKRTPAAKSPGPAAPRFQAPQAPAERTPAPKPAPPASGPPPDANARTAPGPAAGTDGPSRRNLLLSLLGGTVVGGFVGATVPTRPGQGWLGLHGVPWPGGPGPSSVAVHGGDDIDGARANALHVWELEPPNQRARRHATYTDLGALSTEQIDRAKNLLTRRATDLVVIDPQYLAELARARQIRPFDRVTGHSLTELGCYPGIVSQCRVDGDLYAVPLNADAPLLVINLSLLPAPARRRASALADVNDPQAFWTEARAIAAAATRGSRTVRLQTADYEGLTVCLVELICAFGGDVAEDPSLGSPKNQEALRGVRSVYGKETLMTPGGSQGDEAATVAAVAQGETAVARLWPAQTHGLTSATPADEDGAAEYVIVPVPGGVLGGQVLALATHTSNRPDAELIAEHLAQPLAQLQLFTAAGYVPTLRPVHAVTAVNAELRQLGSRLESARLRPTLVEYAQWSATFRTVVRNYLLRATDDLDGAVTQPLADFS
jgi:multiple sugar transport system substrate-binding protein